MTQRTSMGSRRTPRGGMMGRCDVSSDRLRQGVGVSLGVAGSAPRVRGARWVVGCRSGR
jgi:hypothetical protein